MNIFLDVLVDAALDCLRMLPFLFSSFILLELLEHRVSAKMERTLAGADGLGPLAGALLGVVPQCGFSIMASDFYAGNVISMGALLAVYLSTSDEALVLLLSHTGHFKDIGFLIGAKVIIALIGGYAVFAFEKSWRRLHRRQLTKIHEHCDDEPEQKPEAKREASAGDAGEASQMENSAAGLKAEEVTAAKEQEVTAAKGQEATAAKEQETTAAKEQEGTAQGHAHTEEHGHAYTEFLLHHVVMPAFRHTREVFIYLFLFSFVVGFIIELIGEEAFTSILMPGTVFQVILATLIGLIPNCASSVMLTELYLSGALSFGSAVAGLCAGAGLGLPVLFHMNKNLKENGMIVAVLVMISIAAGLFLNITGIAP